MSMNSETNSIPNVEVKSSGGKKNGIQLITGYVDLPDWDGYFLNEGTIYSKEEKRINGGRVELQVDGAINPDGSVDFSKEQVAAYWYLVEHQETIKRIILENMVNNFDLFDPFGDHKSDEQEGGYPRPSQLVTGFDFKDYIGPTSISIDENEKDDAAYTTWYFNCRWDPEHGFQVIMHKDRIIDMGQDPDIDKVYKDNGTYEQVMAAYKPANNPRPFAWKKKWWQFWKKY